MYLLLLLTSLVSCQNSRLKSEAQKQMEVTLKEVAKDPSSVKISDTEVVYNDDSLCIIHANYSARNGFGNETSSKIEYVMLTYNDKNYEALHELSSKDMAVYMSKEDFEKNKKGQIYQRLSYESTLFYLAAVFVNGQGREAGKQDGVSFKIPVPTGTGSWQIGTMKDEFGENTGSKYLYVQGCGTFSNSATNNSRLLVAMYAHDDNLIFLLAEYGNILVKSSDTYDAHIKDAKGRVYNITLVGNCDSGHLSVVSTPFYHDSSSATTLSQLLHSEGVLTFALKQRTNYGTPSTYIFKVDVTGYDKAEECRKKSQEQAYANESYYIAGKEYLKKVSHDPSYKNLDGIYYKVLKAGNGVVPNENSMVTIHYEGRLAEGDVLDSSKAGQPATMRPALTIKGVGTALTHMPVGSTWEIVIPSELGYGDSEFGTIKPYSTLIFKIELLGCND